MPNKTKTPDGRTAGLDSSLSSGSRLRWDRYPDEDQNTMMEAVGGSTDGESGDLYYRIKQGVRCDRHVWIEASSPELMIDEEGPLTWPDAHSAKERIQAHHDAIMRDYLSSANDKVQTCPPKTKN